MELDVKAFWDAVLRQDADAIRGYFHPDAWVNWHNTNEHLISISLLPPMCTAKTRRCRFM